MRYFPALLSIFVLCFLSVQSQAYEEVKVNNSVTLKGMVVFKGKIPKVSPIIIDRDNEYCGIEQPVKKYIISDSKVKNVFVWIEGITKGKPIPNKQIEVIIKDCRATSLASVGFVGNNYVFRNDDPILHTVQLKLGLKFHEKLSSRPIKDGATIFNLAMPKQGREVKKPVKRYHRYTEDTGFIRITSNTHNWIRGTIFIFDHPYASVTDKNGNFVLDNIPAGEYTIKIWHEGFGYKSGKIKLSSGQVKKITIDLSKEGEISASEDKGLPVIKISEERYKFGTVKKGEVIRHDFEFVNEGDAVLEIVELIPA